MTAFTIAEGQDSAPFLRFYDTDDSDGGATTLIAAPPALPATPTHACVAKWNPRAGLPGEPCYLAILEATVGLRIWKFEGGAFTDLALVAPTSFQAHSGNSLAWDELGRFLAVGGLGSASAVTVYEVVGNLVTKRATLAHTNGALNGVNGLAWSNIYRTIAGVQTPKYLAIVTNLNPQVTWWRYDGGPTFTALATPPTLPTTQGRSVTWSGTTLIVGSNNTPFLHSWAINTGTDVATKNANPATLPDGSVEAVAAFPGGADTVAVGQIPGGSGKTLRIYVVSTNSFATLPALQPPSSVFDIGWLDDEALFYEGNFNSRRFSGYDLAHHAVATQRPLPDTDPGGTCRSASWGPTFTVLGGWTVGSVRI